jgi:hypothetical protein
MKRHRIRTSPSFVSLRRSPDGIGPGPTPFLPRRSHTEVPAVTTWRWPTPHLARLQFGQRISAPRLAISSLPQGSHDSSALHRPDFHRIPAEASPAALTEYPGYYSQRRFCHWPHRQCYRPCPLFLIAQHKALHACRASKATGSGPTRNLCRRRRRRIAAVVVMRHFFHWSCHTPGASGSPWRWFRLRDPTGNTNRIKANS